MLCAMVQNPAWWPVTAGTESVWDATSAIAGLSLAHVTTGFTAGWPFASPTAAWSRIVPPTPTDVGPEILM